MTSYKLQFARRMALALNVSLHQVAVDTVLAGSVVVHFHVSSESSHDPWSTLQERVANNTLTRFFPSFVSAQAHVQNESLVPGTACTSSRSLARASDSCLFCCNTNPRIKKGYDISIYTLVY